MCGGGGGKGETLQQRGDTVMATQSSFLMTSLYFISRQQTISLMYQGHKRDLWNLEIRRAQFLN